MEIEQGQGVDPTLDAVFYFVLHHYRPLQKRLERYHLLCHFLVPFPNWRLCFNGLTSNITNSSTLDIDTLAFTFLMRPFVSVRAFSVSVTISWRVARANLARLV